MKQIADRLVDALRSAATVLPGDVVEALERARSEEESGTARSQLDAILENVRLAREKNVPICQDTGMQTFFVTAGINSQHLRAVLSAIPKAVERSTKEIPLRPNTVSPFTGQNPGNNLGPHMPITKVEIVEGDEIRIDILPKGGGSENISQLWMLTPSEGLKGARRRMLEHVRAAGGKPCPPVVLGIGIGGGADYAMHLGKKALLRPLGQRHPEPSVAALELEILRDINALGIGPMGLGGRTTALDLHIEYTYRHPATFPVGLVVQCWADRRASVIVSGKGEIEVLQ
ncbi:MAG: fumarate hydratase [Candidatus Thermoplasmatota archaeon]